MKNFIVLALACCIAVTGLAYNAGAFAPTPVIPQDWGPDTFVDLEQIPEELTFTQTHRRMPTWEEFAIMEATAVMSEGEDHFSHRRSSSFSNEHFAERFELGPFQDQALTTLRSVWQADQDMLYDNAEWAMAAHQATLLETASVWLHIAPIYAPRPVPPIASNGQPGGEGEYWRLGIVEEGGWHGYWLWDSNDFNDVSGLLAEVKVIADSEILDARGQF